MKGVVRGNSVILSNCLSLFLSAHLSIDPVAFTLQIDFKFIFTAFTLTVVSSARVLSKQSLKIQWTTLSFQQLESIPESDPL